jgi:hypothetical protein
VRRKKSMTADWTKTAQDTLCIRSPIYGGLRHKQASRFDLDSPPRSSARSP